MVVCQYCLSLYLSPAHKLPKSNVVSCRYKMPGLKELRRTPVKFLQSVLAEGHILLGHVLLVGLEGRACVWPAHRGSSDTT